MNNNLFGNLLNETKKSKSKTKINYKTITNQ